MSVDSIGSILAVDFGSVHTRVLLFDLVDGEYRLVARGIGRTTMGYPVDDVNVGLQRILNDISEVTGRVFYDKNDTLITPERTDRSGVDYFVTTASAGRPIRVVMVGLVPDLSIKTALRATTGSYVEPVASIHLDDGKNEEQRLNTILLNRPDLIFVSGGTDGGARTAIMDLMKLVKLAVSLIPPSLRPSILYAGNAKLANQVRDLIGDSTKIFIAPNVRPTDFDEELEPAQIILGHAYDEHKERNGFAFRNIANMSNSGVLPTAQSISLMTEFLGRMQGINALALDVGSAATVLSVYMNEEINTAIRTDIGLGHSSFSLLEVVGEEAIREWLPFFPEQDELINYALNKGLRPATVPMTLRELYLETAFLRAGVRHVLAEARINWRNLPLYGDLPQIGLIIGAGAGLTGTGHSALDMLMMLDCIQPTGITEFKADPNGIIPALGALAIREPHAVVQLLDSSALEHLGMAICVSGIPSAGSRALKLKITTEDGEVFEHEIAGGDVWHLPLPANHELKIDIRVSRGLTIGSQRRVKMTLVGGKAGIIFDARGRALPLGSSPSERAENMPRWIAAVTEQEIQEIPTDWLEEPEIVIPEPIAEVRAIKAPPARGRRGKKEKEVEAIPSMDARIKKATGELPALFDDLEDEDLDPNDLDALFEDEDDNKADKELGSLRDLL